MFPLQTTALTRSAPLVTWALIAGNCVITVFALGTSGATAGVLACFLLHYTWAQLIIPAPIVFLTVEYLPIPRQKEAAKRPA
jgi:membrane associated rhomboid family serine protease